MGNTFAGLSVQLVKELVGGCWHQDVAQRWGYHKTDGAGVNVAGKDHGNGLGTCTRGTGNTVLNSDEEVGRCTVESGNSEF